MKRALFFEHLRAIWSSTSDDVYTALSQQALIDSKLKFFYGGVSRCLLYGGIIVQRNHDFLKTMTRHTKVYDKTKKKGRTIPYNQL